MSVQKIRPVVLCGGSGTRLWPLSRKGFPKQFIPIYQGKSLLQLTFERVSGFGDVIALTGEEHRFFVQEAADAANVVVEQILEPCARDTAPAMALAAVRNIADDNLLLFCPADHFIPDSVGFMNLINSAMELAETGSIVTFGVQPNFPSTAYGYIETGENLDGGAKKCARFHEKPSVSSAVEFFSSGRFLWNAGVFLVKASVLIDALCMFEPDILRVCKAAIDEVKQDGNFFRPGEVFAEATAKSIDYAVMEHAENIAVFPFEGVWSDVGSWNAMFELSEKGPDGTGRLGVAENIRMVNSQNTLVHATDRRLVVTLGTKDLVIIDTPDALLVSSFEQVENVKDVVAELSKEEHSQAIEHRRVARPWGNYDSIDQSDRFQVKRITVKPGAKLSLQRHHHRAEHWIVVKGTALVTCGDQEFLLGENQSTYIPVGAIHRMENPGKISLELIEVQSGSYLGEDDIERIEDKYGRILN